jgi:hypothetical protein
MKDRFEKFIEENREHFDFREPDQKIWEKLSRDIRVKRRLNWQVILKRAAIVIIIFAASFLTNEFVHRVRNNNLAGNKSGRQNAIPGLREAEAYYTGLVNQKLNELKPVIENCPSLQEELNFDLSGLDSVYIELKSDLKDNMANQEVIEAIIENYRLKITILEDILSELEPLGDECISKKDEYAL